MNLLPLIMAADEAAPKSAWSSIWPLLLIGGAMVLMMVMTIIPQKKRQKKAQEMMSKLKVGDKIKTIGGFMGEVTAVDEATNSLIINIGGENNQVLVTIDKAAVYTVLNQNMQQNANAVEQVAVEEQGATTADDIASESKKQSKKGKKAKAVDAVVTPAEGAEAPQDPFSEPVAAAEEAPAASEVEVKKD